MDETLYKVINQRSGEVIASRVKIAQDYRSRSVGLLNRASLEDDEGLLIRPCNSIHTFFMKFPIDVVFLDKLGKVAKIKEGLRQWRLSGCPIKGYMVLELSSGKLKKNAIRVGDTLTIHKT